MTSPHWRARVGAFVLSLTVMLPIAISAASYLTLDEQPHTDEDTRFGFASLMLGTSAVASLIGLLGLVAFTLYKPKEKPESVLTLRMLAVLKTLGDSAAFGILFVPSLQVWQTSVALTLFDVVFAVALLRFIALVLDDLGAPGVARSTRQFVWVYGVTRMLLMLVWVLPEELAMLSMMHRAVAPILDGVLAFLLLKCATMLVKPRAASDGAAPPS